jgi:thiamine-phosphate pyrophosphorylase
MNVIGKDVLRLIDANLNRSREGLRVCEDICRFIFNSPGLTKDLKTARHDVTALAKHLNGSTGLLLKNRNTEEDVGRDSFSATEMKRSGACDIFSANIERVKESLRVLEEFSKLIDTKISVKFSRLRFKVYDIEKKAALRTR